MIVVAGGVVTHSVRGARERVGDVVLSVVEGELIRSVELHRDHKGRALLRLEHATLAQGDVQHRVVPYRVYNVTQALPHLSQTVCRH